MKINLKEIVDKNDVVAVAVSGGCDSMSLLYYMQKASEKLNFKVVAINVEHGIRGEASIKDSEFVKNYCDKNGIKLFFYKVDCLKKAKEEKLSVEQAGRILRYSCFSDALEKGYCTKIATAHHLKDNAESVLFNLFRGTGTKGIIGINYNFKDKIIRPFLSVPKEEIEEYAKQNSVDFVTDETNFDTDYTRNYIRLNVIPAIKKVFPEFEKSLYRLSEISEIEDEYMDDVSEKAMKRVCDGIEIKLPLSRAVLNRCVIKALKELGLKRDWEKIHADDVYKLSAMQTGLKISLPKNIIAIKEYDKIVIMKKPCEKDTEIPFKVGDFNFNGKKISVTPCLKAENLKDGFYLDYDKVPLDSVIRTKRNGDVFKKFNGGTKKLGDYLTDLKIPLRERNGLPVIASGNRILAIFGLAISDDVKIDGTTEKIIKLI